jgi:hypothetical protein
MSEFTQPTPLDRARELIELRARATQGEWRAETKVSGPQMNGDHQLQIQLRLNNSLIYSRAARAISAPNHDHEFLAHAANHAAEVAQALIEAQAENARLRADRKAEA